MRSHSFMGRTEHSHRNSPPDSSAAHYTPFSVREPPTRSLCPRPCRDAAPNSSRLPPHPQQTLHHLPHHAPPRPCRDTYASPEKEGHGICIPVLLQTITRSTP